MLKTGSPHRHARRGGARLASAAIAVIVVIGLTSMPASASNPTNCDTDFLPEPPSNDNRATTTEYLGSSRFSAAGVTCWATKEPGEPAHAGQAAAKSVWLNFDTPQGFTARIDVFTNGSDFDTRLAVYSSSTGSLVEQNDDISSANQLSKVSFLRSPGGTTAHVPYKVAIDGYTSTGGDTADGRYVVSWSQPLVAFTSTAHLARSIARVYDGREPTPTEYKNTQAGYKNGHDKQPGWLADDLSEPGINEAMPVARLYTAVFNRLPDPSGLSYWLKKRRAGTTLNAIAAPMAASSEFTATYGQLTTGQFVDLVYQNVLKRSPDASGSAYWVQKLNGGFKRSAMMAQFSESNEFVTKSQRLMEAAIVWRLGHGSWTDAQLKALATTHFYRTDYFGLLIEDPQFQAYIAGF